MGDYDEKGVLNEKTPADPSGMDAFDRTFTVAGKAGAEGR
jgi:hypothetical protein